MLIGVKFCGGCNPRYDRGKALEAIRQGTKGAAAFVIAEEGTEYDRLLVIGGCTNCCASVDRYTVKGDSIRMWDEDHIDTIINNIKKWGNDI